ncbi:hypothetical protein [Streptomyces sp. NBC_01217]|uniref:hypothetical protein n=1 Tax=Streptomyces sp. NBC_01217 TaxID=2903779 RepID=UPI002E124761|nr:hypothetical protein OG507_27115 [Streptomyces sp. NBC_01217]
MNTILNVLGTAVLIGLFLVPALAGLARERRIDRQLREAERERGHTPPETADAAQPMTVRRPHLGSWARI